MSSDKPDAIYGIQRRAKLAGKEISSSSTLAFTTQLSSLIADKSSNSSSRGGTASNPTHSRSSRSGRDGKKTDPIFRAHNRGVLSRATTDKMHYDEYIAKHAVAADADSTSSRLDRATWSRVQTKMEEKVRIYEAAEAAAKADTSEQDEDPDWVRMDDVGEQVMDFSRRRGRPERKKPTRSLYRPDEEEELVEFEDEFGRTRRGTRAEAAEHGVRPRDDTATDDHDNQDEDGLGRDGRRHIFGNVIQHDAFVPSVETAERMAELAAKADRSPSPVTHAHYDSKVDIRQRGQGFFQFSTDEATRQAEMAALQKDRQQTERERVNVVDRRQKRREELQRRRVIIMEKRKGRQASRFLDELGIELDRRVEG